MNFDTSARKQHIAATQQATGKTRDGELLFRGGPALGPNEGVHQVEVPVPAAQNINGRDEPSSQTEGILIKGGSLNISSEPQPAWIKKKKILIPVNNT